MAVLSLIKSDELDAALDEKTYDVVLNEKGKIRWIDRSGEEEIGKVVDAFRALPSKIDAIVDFQWGTNNSPEGLNEGFTHCFLQRWKP